MKSLRKSRGSHSQVLYKISVLKNFPKFTVKHLRGNLIFDKVLGPEYMFSCEFCEVYKNAYLNIDSASKC